jgi:hypothetical protein
MNRNVASPVLSAMVCVTTRHGHIDRGSFCSARVVQIRQIMDIGRMTLPEQAHLWSSQSDQRQAD